MNGTAALLCPLVFFLLAACASTHSEIYTEPQNLDFEIAGSEGLPAKWHGPRDGSNSGCYYLVTREKPATGDHCLLITSQEAGASGFIEQKVDAESFRGKALCLRAAVKVDKGQAHLFLRIYGPTEELFNDWMHGAPIISRYWSYHQIKCPVVPENADRVEFGGYIEANSKACFDDFQLVAMEEGKEAND